MSQIHDAELALIRAIQCGTNGGFCFSVSNTDSTPIRSVKDAQDHLDKLMLKQQIQQLKAKIAAMEVKAAEAAKVTSALQAVAEKVAHFAMEA